MRACASAAFNRRMKYTVPVMYGYCFFRTEKCKKHEVFLSTTTNDARTFRQILLSEHIKSYIC